MRTILTEVVIILALLVLNGIFAMSELAIVSAKRVRLEHRAERGDAGARAALALAGDAARFLSTVQVGITLVGVIASVFGGATIAEILAARFEQVAWLAEHAEGVALTIVVAGITFLSLIVGELVPKRIALSDPERVASLVARPMRVVATIAHPLVAVLTGASNVVLRLFGLHGRVEPGLTEEEIHALVEQGAESGVVPQAEHDIVEGVFRLGDRQVASIMTPRPDVEWVDLTTETAELREALVGHGRRYLLVCEGDLEHIAGVAYVDDLLRLCLGEQRADLRSALSVPVYVPATMPVLRLLEVLREAGQQVAVALDEYGGLLGVVTLDDILEGIVGPLPSADEAPALAPVGHGTWVADGSALAADVEELLDLAPLDVEGGRGFRTLGGFFMSHMGRVPAEGDEVVHGGHRFTVEAMDGRRVARVRIERADAPDADAPS
ncbi:MAG TPA: hemolysin family protein [Gemmatimonadaceae bacterium]|nr:hemolysin family protein [Gemmatimonadaceae bacterium]